MSLIAQALKNYNYVASKPLYIIDRLTVFEATHKQTNQNHYIKILKKPDSQLVSYLQKLKSAHSEYVIKFNEIINDHDSSQLLIVQQAASYGTLDNAIKKCKRLEDDDSLTISKILLNGHIQLMRVGTYWFGNQKDIQFTENGIKLSWNNTMPFSQNNQNPFPKILQNIGERKQSNSILVFPQNKMLSDLINVSRENASQMSLHPLLKKKQKIFKKKGKNWLGIKQIKIKGQYSQQLSYLGISNEHGFIRVKFSQKGQIDNQLLKICQTNPSFVKILDYYQEGKNFITISEYSNDGTVQNYVKRLKNSNIQLKQNQIQFFFFSLIQPLKFIHKSPVISLNMLHIKNIYIQNGVVKIGQPFPLTETIKQILVQRADIPDFYHKDYKTSPNTKNATYDTYSLGVLLYKLMYTEYPIFPQNKVHIPTTPNYKPKLKSTLQTFLDKGGSLQELQQVIEVSEDVKLQVKNNEKILNQANGLKKSMSIRGGYVQEQNNNEIVSQLSIVHNQQEQNQEANVKPKSKCARFYQWISKRGRDPQKKYSHLYNSPYALYRECTQITIVLMLYFFAFFIFYLVGIKQLFSSTRLFTRAYVNILGQKQYVIIANYDDFLTSYNQIIGNSPASVSALQEMNCLIDNSGVYYDFLRPDSPHWYIFLFLSIIAMFTILILKGLQLSKFSTIRVGYHYYDHTISGVNQSRFALSSYIFFQLWFGMALYTFFYLFNIVFNSQCWPCFGGNIITKLTLTLLSDRWEFTTNYLIITMIIFGIAILSFTQIYKLYEKINYDQLCNPIFIFGPLYIGVFFTTRLGIFSAFNPSYLHNNDGYIGQNYINTIGYFPEFLVIAELILCWLIDLIYQRYMDKRLQNFLLDDSVAQINQK